MTSFDGLTPKIAFIQAIFFFIEKQLKFHAQLSWACKKFYNLGARTFKHPINERLIQKHLGHQVSYSGLELEKKQKNIIVFFSEKQPFM